MDRFIVIKFLIILIMLVHQVTLECPQCTNDDLHSIKLVCQQKGQHLERAELTKNATIVCNGLDELLTCVAEKVPQCLSKFGRETQKYRFTPWDCHLSQTQVFRYQEIINNGCKTTNDTRNVSVWTLPENVTSITKNEFTTIKKNKLKSSKSSDLSFNNERNSASTTDYGIVVPLGLLCIQLIKLWRLEQFP